MTRKAREYQKRQLLGRLGASREPSPLFPAISLVPGFVVRFRRSRAFLTCQFPLKFNYTNKREGTRTGLNQGFPPEQT
jgi:hypothetical protein